MTKIKDLLLGEKDDLKKASAAYDDGDYHDALKHLKHFKNKDGNNVKKSIAKRIKRYSQRILKSSE